MRELKNMTLHLDYNQTVSIGRTVSTVYCLHPQ